MSYGVLGPATSWAGRAAVSVLRAFGVWYWLRAVQRRIWTMPLPLLQRTPRSSLLRALDPRWTPLDPGS